MKWILYIVLFLGALLVPGEATDVGKLIPVEVIAFSGDAGTIYIEADTGDKGKGATLAEAIADMEKSASGVIYLDTAQYLILEPGMEGAAESLRQYLKGDVRVCSGTRGIKLEGIAEYLDVHKPAVKLFEVEQGAALQVVREENGRYELLEK